MFIFSVRPKRKILFWGCLAIFLLILIICAFSCRSQTQPQTSIPTDGSDNQKRIAFLAQYGWEVEEEPIECKDIAIPMTFGGVYQQYNEIQIKQGYDLEAYKGKTVKHYSYAVTNYPDTSHSVRANLLIYEGEIIGGDICSLNIDGFMHGFAKDK